MINEIYEFDDLIRKDIDKKTIYFKKTNENYLKNFKSEK